MDMYVRVCMFVCMNVYDVCTYIGCYVNVSAYLQYADNKCNVRYYNVYETDHSNLLL